MDDEKERLEKELRFLKESLEANIISEEEYEKGKKRIEKRLDELGAKVEEKDEELTTDDIKGYGEEKKETASHILDEVEKEAEKESKKQEDWVAKELKELEEQKLVEPKPEKKVAKESKVSAKPKVEEKSQKSKISEGLEVKSQSKPEPKEEKAKPKKTVEQKEEADSEGEITPIKIDRKALRIIGIIAIIILYMLIKRAPTSTTDVGPDVIPEEEEFIPVCSADEECIETGKVGICIEPGTKEAACEFLEPLEVELTIINDRTCESCDTSRMLNILRQLFPGIKGSLVDANSPAGRSLINELGVNVLPAYVFGSEINETMKFDKFKRALVKSGDNYLVNPTASGSNYFFTKLSKPATIDMFVKSGQDTTIMDNSMKEVANLFGDQIAINRQVVEKADEIGLERAFAITTYPAYVINNQLKFTGTQASEIIKNRFCYLNALPECGTTLSLDIVS